MKRPHVKHAALIFATLLTIAGASRTSLAASPSAQGAVAGSRPEQVGEVPSILTVQAPSGGMSRLMYV